MKLQGFKRIIKESLPEQSRQLADVIGASMNDFAEEVINGFNKNITVDDNLNMQYKDIEVSVNSSGIPLITTQFKSILNTKVRGITVIRAENLTNTTTYPTNTPFITFSESNKIITLNHISGLPASNKFKLTLLSVG